MSLKSSIDPNRLPRHIAVIMDGNGRWAKQQGKNRIFGHNAGVDRVREMTETCAELGVDYLTLYTFSTENWNRPKLEVSALMELLVQSLRKETKRLNENDIRLRAIGDLESLPKKCRDELNESMDITRNNTRMDLVLALSYSGRKEIMDAIRGLLKDYKSGELTDSSITEEALNRYLYTANMPDPELLIRTSGENRVSNFLLWQIAYAEFYFTSKFWPEFTEEELYKAIITFQNRERRFGKTSEQVVNE